MGGAAQTTKRGVMSHTDWKRLRFEYEVLGDSEDAIVKRHGVSALLLQNIVENEGWTRKPIADQVNTWTDQDNPAEHMVEVADKASLLNTLRAAQLGPEYFRAESAILAKITETVQNLDAKDESAAKVLKAMGDTLVALRPPAPVAGAEEKDSGIQIVIAQGYGVGQHTPESEAIDVTVPKEIENATVN